MTTEPNYRPGLLVALIVLCLYGGLALSVDFPRAAFGFQSDEATYYMMGHSLAQDGDLTYRRDEDLVRVWHEFPSGPTGVFLKRGRDVVDWGLMLKPPFFWTSTVDDPQSDSRGYYGKSFIYAAFAAPFVRLFGTNGFLVLNALLLTLATWFGYLFLQTRVPAWVAAVLSAGFVMASVVPVYFVWIAPELFNFSLSVVAYCCWLYKEVAAPGQAPRGHQWLTRGVSDAIASIVLGILTFSKATNVLLFPPLVLWWVWRREWRRALTNTVVFGIVAAGLFAINLAITGEWNYQGGEDRRTFVNEFPFQTEKSGFGVGTEKERNEALTDIIFDRRVFWTNLRHSLGYFFVGRFSGLVPYFFPAVFALLFFVAGIRRRPAWQYLVMAAAVGQILLFVIATPYTWNGGGGSVGNRYFMNAYGLFLFALPVTSRFWVALMPWIIGSVFTAPLVLNPFYSSFYPGSYAKHGPLRMFPVELTLVYDWPINTDTSRVRVWFGDHKDQGDPGFQIYFFDDNAYLPEGDKTFWVKGASRSEFLIKTDRPMKQAVIALTAGAVPTEVDVTIAGRSQRVSLRAGEQQRVMFALPPGFPYQAIWPVWTASVSSSSGFVPIFYEADTTDTRFLGVRVDPVLVP
jgi:hypothetical protein